jgi:hypothetical protein
MGINRHLIDAVKKVLAYGEDEAAIDFDCPGPVLKKAAESGDVRLGGRTLTGGRPVVVL